MKSAWCLAAWVLISAAVVNLTCLEAAQFKSGADVVPVYATVRSSQGRLVTGLTADDFEILEDKVARPIDAFSARVETIAILAMFQTGYLRGADSTGRDPQARALAVGHALIDALWPTDRLRHGTFGNEISISPISTADQRELRWIVDEETWIGYGHTPFWDALDVAINISRRETARRVILVLGSGLDSSRFKNGGTSSDGVVANALRADAMVYGISLEKRGLDGGLKQAAERTGGGAFEMGDDEPAATLKEVMQELHSQYLLGFSSALDGREHALEVRVKVGGSSVRARKSYFAVKR